MSAQNTIRSSAHPTLYPFPGVPAGWPALMQRRAQDDLDLVTAHYDGFAEHLENSFDEHADVEDFWETCARAAAAVRAAQALGAEFIDQEIDFAWDESTLDQRLGSVANIELDRHGVDPLLLHPVVKKHAGRWISMASLPDEERPHLVFENNFYDLVRQRAEAGVERLVIKLPASKEGIMTLGIEPGLSDEQIFSRLIADEHFGWTFIRLMGQRDALLVQDWVPMTYEYRLFVVDGKVISGAGCIEEFTPYSRQHPGIKFDTRVRKFRGNDIAAGRGMSTDPEYNLLLVDRYLAKGHQIAREHGGTVGLDLALVTRDDGSQEIIVVELNTLPNCGLYASSVDAVYEALSTAEDRGYGTYAWKQDVPAGDLFAALPAPEALGAQPVSTCLAVDAIDVDELDAE